MKNTIIIAALLGIVFLVPFVAADVVNMNISVNGTSNLNITVDADDTLAREMIGETQEDVYGTLTGSSPKDVVLNQIANTGSFSIQGTEGSGSVDEICNDPSLQQYFSSLGDLPTQEFIDHLKSLGYDDEAHINLIWTVCQQQYIKQNEGEWSLDEVGGGLQQEDLVSIFKAAIEWLTGGGNSVYTKAKDLAIILESHFASDRDLWIVANRVKQVELRVEALERTIEKIAAEEYCETKLEMMKEYNLTGVKCGINSTHYWNAKKAGFDNYELIAYETCDEDWMCVDWSECVDGVQTRKCVDKNACGTFENRPVETKECPVSLQQAIESPFVALARGSQVEEYLTLEQVMGSYLSLLLVIFIATAASLIFIGIKKDSVRRFRRR